MSEAPAPPGLSPTLSQRLTLIIQTLRTMIAARAGRDRSAEALVKLAWGYLHRVAMRFEALVLRVRDGAADMVPKARPAGITPRPRPPRAPSRLPRAHLPRAHLPRGFAWMIRLAPETAPLGSQLRHLLADPAFSSLLAADPRAGKILRPLVRMLGVSPGPDLPPALFQPQAPRRSRAPKRPTIETPAASSPAPDWPKRQTPPRRRGRRRPLWGSSTPA